MFWLNKYRCCLLCEAYYFNTLFFTNVYYVLLCASVKWLCLFLICVICQFWYTIQNIIDEEAEKLLISTIQNTIGPFRIPFSQEPFRHHWTVFLVPFKYHSTVYIHRPPKYHWSTIQIPLAIIPHRTIQIPFKYHSNVYIHRPPKYHWSTIQIPFKYHWPLYPLVPFNGIWMVFFCKGAHSMCRKRMVDIGGRALTLVLFTPVNCTDVHWGRPCSTMKKVFAIYIRSACITPTSPSALSW